jgi:hypothetical protein
MSKPKRPSDISNDPSPPDIMAKRNLLICFDAFGTLFAPKRPIAQQYAEVASSLAKREFTEDEVQKSFGKAFKKESKANPNYGKATGMDAEKWWTNVGLSYVYWRFVW